MIDIIIDGQWGSTGKGKLAGYLAKRNTYGAVICDYGPNTGHTYAGKEGTFIFTTLPIGALFIEQVYLGPTCVINHEKFEYELNLVSQYRKTADLSPVRVSIHPHAAVVTAEARQWERDNLQRISSTLKGTGATNAWKVMRHPSSMLAKDCMALKPWVNENFEDEMWLIHDSGLTVLGETSQGFDLSLNWGTTYPYVTSRDITLGTAMNSFGVPPSLLNDVWGSIRVFPIRVGNTTYQEDGKELVGSSGPHYKDQKELTWKELGVKKEHTTVTGKVRRIFSFSEDQIIRFIRMCEPEFLFLNFANYFGCDGARSEAQFPQPLNEWIESLETLLNRQFGNKAPRINLVGTGASDEDMVRMSTLTKVN